MPYLFCLALALGLIAVDDTTDADALPLDPERRLTFSTTEGSWMSLDVSPDGATIVFDLLGDLYLLPSAGGEAERLTAGMGFDAQPRFSPDGRHVVFTSDRSGGENIWLLDLETREATAVTEGKNYRYNSPEWTPDGDYIVVSRSDFRSGSHKPWLFHRDGGSGVQLVKEPENMKLTGAAFGPDERHLWLARRTGDWQYNAIFPQYQLVTYDRETGTLQDRSARFGSAFAPTLSPDGRWLVYGTRHDAQTGLRLRDLNTGEERWLAYPVQRDDQESRATRDVLPGMSFTPDSRALVVSYGGGIWRVPVEGGEATPIPFMAEVDLEMGPELDFDYPVDDDATFVARQIRDAVPSPDGRRLAFTALDRLYVMDWPDGSPRRLTDADLVEAQPTWSPDGAWIAYTTWSEDLGGHLYKVRANGQGAPLRLTETAAYYLSPAWAPDADRIAAIRGTARAFRDATGPRAAATEADLVRVPADGGAATVVMPASGYSDPHFAGSSDRIYLTKDDALVSVRWDGTDEKAHLKVQGLKVPGDDDPLEADLLLMAPSGRQALAQIRTDLYVVAVPYVGGETPTISVADPAKAAVPARRLTEIGAQFPAWSSDGRRAHWSIGNAHVVYDLDAAEAFEDSVAAAEENGDDNDDDDENGEEARYRPEERRVEVTLTRDRPRGAAVLRGARVITMNGDEVIENADVVVQDTRVAAVGPQGTVEAPEGAEVIDVSGKTIVPGFVDVHAHMRPAWGLHRADVWTYAANLAYGVTTTRDPQTGTTDVLTYADHVEAGTFAGPRIYSTGPGVFWQEQVKDLDHARRILKRYSDYYDTKTIKMYVAGNREQRQWIIQAAREQELMPTTEGALDFKLNLTQVIDGYPGHEHAFPIFPLYDDVVRLVAESRSVYTPTLLVAYGGPFAENYFYTRENPHDDPRLRRFTPHEELDEKTRRRGQGTGPGPGGWFRDDEHVFAQHAEFVEDLVDAGGRAAVGSHGQLQGLGYHWELWAMQAGGLDEHDALRVATIIGADAIGLDGDLGSIEPGKLADLIVLDENPLDDIRHTNTVRLVMKNGRLYEADTLDEVYPNPQPAGPFWWQEDADPVDLPGLAEP